MEALHRWAGMTETTNPHDQPSHPVPEPPAIPQDPDTDPQDANSIRASRASLPLNRRASHKSFRSGKSGKSARGSPVLAPADYPPLPAQQLGRLSYEGGADADGGAGAGEGEAEIPWGPSHPCFPHPNPHCAPASPEYASTRVVRVKRDWLAAGDLYPQFANLYPEILDPLVTDAEFRLLISNINARLKEIFNPYGTRAWVDSVMGAATGYVWDDLGLTGAKRGVRALEAWLERWNKDMAREGREVKLVQLRRTGFMVLDFVVPDPGIDVVGGEQGQEDQGEGDDGEGEGGIGPAE